MNELREVLRSALSQVRRLWRETWGWTINTAICLRCVGQLEHALPVWFGSEANPLGASEGHAAASVCASGQQGGPRRGKSQVRLTWGSFCHQWSQWVWTSLGTSRARTHPKPNAFPFPWENHFCSYFGLLKIFQYHNNHGRQWTQGYRQGQRCEPTSRLGQIEKKFLQLWKYFIIISTCESKAYCFYNLSKTLNDS